MENFECVENISLMEKYARGLSAWLVPVSDLIDGQPVRNRRVAIAIEISSKDVRVRAYAAPAADPGGFAKDISLDRVEYSDGVAIDYGGTAQLCRIDMFMPGNLPTVRAKIPEKLWYAIDMVLRCKDDRNPISMKFCVGTEASVWCYGDSVWSNGRRPVHPDMFEQFLNEGTMREIVNLHSDMGSGNAAEYKGTMVRMEEAFQRAKKFISERELNLTAILVENSTDISRTHVRIQSTKTQYCLSLGTKAFDWAEAEKAMEALHVAVEFKTREG